jgi:chromosomal replication initiation ATPase DnaA
MNSIDDILNKLHEVTQNQHIHSLIKQFCEAVLTEVDVPKALWKDNLIDTFFNKELENSKKRFIAICLLRLLNVNDSLFKETDFRVKVFRLFDEVFSHDIYKCLKIDIKDQGYEKESKLKGVVSKLEKDLSELILSFNNLNLVDEFQARFMQNINYPLYKAILWPFLPKKLLEVRLKEVFRVVKEYLDESSPRALQLYNIAKNTLEFYRKEACKHGTRYSYDYLNGLSEKLLKLLEDHFQKNPISKPAELSIEVLKNKYPFYISGKEIDLDFILKNNSSGFAFDVEVRVEASIHVNKAIHYIGQISPKSSLIMQIPCKVEKAEENVLVLIEANWINFDTTPNKKQFEFMLECQRSDIDWEKLSKEQPYSLEPITKEDEFVGRNEILNRLESLVTANDGIGSVFIYGQKRVGKTSIVKILKTRLEKKYPNFIVVYLEGGEYIHPEPKITIENLGKTLIRRIKSIDRFAGIDLSTIRFEGALSPLSEFLDSVNKIAPEIKILFILDEFDELPIELYKRGPLGDAFFLTIRSISGKPPFGFILVGGEKMEYIISCQGDALNKFHSCRIDYFDKEEHWTDFQNLVKKPVQNWLEITDQALSTLFEETAGNPYFTKLICKELSNIMVERKDSYVTPREIEDAVKIALRNVASNAFQHFWEDGIIDTGPRVEEKSVMRRKMLLALAESIREGLPMLNKIKDKCLKWGVFDYLIEHEFREFEQRKIIIVKDDIYGFKVKFFEKWLVEKGVQEILTTLIDYDSLAREKKEEERVRVSSEEIVNLVKKWGIYKGRLITEDQVRAWLNQFGDYKKQRMMFKILQAIKFYTNDSIRAKMREAHNIIKRNLIWRMEEKKRKRSDILISYLDYPGKSGAFLAKIYADENEIYFKNVVERVEITDVLKRKSEELQAFALVFIDDFIGTGNSACEYFKRLVSEHGEILKRLSKEPGEIEGSQKLQMFFIAICGFPEAQNKIEELLVNLDLPVKVHICDPLSKSEEIFSEKSTIFENISEREEAKQITYEFGVKLVRDAPLGYDGTQTIIVFEHNCPNNSLPILWAESKDFRPLFRRG